MKLARSVAKKTTASAISSAVAELKPRAAPAPQPWRPYDSHETEPYWFSILAIALQMIGLYGAGDRKLARVRRRQLVALVLCRVAFVSLLALALDDSTSAQPLVEEQCESVLSRSLNPCNLSS